MESGDEAAMGFVDGGTLHICTHLPRAAQDGSVVASISVGSDAVGSGDDPAMGTVDGKYSSPPPGDPGP